jgi:hypothetical protein
MSELSTVIDSCGRHPMADQIKGRRARVTVEPGQRFGNWLVLEVGPHLRTPGGRLALRCQCTLCGSVVDVCKGNLLRGMSRSCQPCAVRRSRIHNPERTNRMVVNGAITRLPQISSAQIDELLAAVVAERDRREPGW